MTRGRAFRENQVFPGLSRFQAVSEKEYLVIGISTAGGRGQTGETINASSLIDLR